MGSWFSYGVPNIEGCPLCLLMRLVEACRWRLYSHSVVTRYIGYLKLKQFRFKKIYIFSTHFLISFGEEEESAIHALLRVGNVITERGMVKSREHMVTAVATFVFQKGTGGYTH